ncbi:MAG: amidohydrolase [Mailhella sp.]|nr:amidohydrolase [Mailhella sp.]
MPFATEIYHGGTILTVDSRFSRVHAMAVRDGIILGVGSMEEMLAFAGPQTRMIDLQGRTMLPGFYDGHSHFMRAGQHYLYYLDLSCWPIGPITSLEQAADKLKKHASSTAPGEWIIATGYDETALKEQRHFTLEELDGLCPRNPLYIRHISGHIALVNSLALSIAGIGEDTADPPGARFTRDVQGRLTGKLEEPPAMNMVLDAAPPMSLDKWLQAAAHASRMYLAKGITTAHDGGVTTEMWDAYMEANRRGMVKNRVQLLPKHGKGGMDFGRLPFSTPGAPLTKDGMLSLGAVKLFQDGSIQAYTAFLSTPYHKVIYDELDDGWRGFAARSREELADIVTAYHRKGWQVAIHGNGDDAIEDILCAFEAAQKAYPRHDARHVVIHCQTVREDQLDRMRRLGVIASFFVLHTYYWGDRHRDIFLGEARASRIDPLNSALKRGITFTLHNDTMVTPIDALLSVWSAVTRQTAHGNVLGPGQCISVEDALRAVTIWGAVQHHEESIKGSLEPGKFADMVILDQDPTRIDPSTIRRIPIAATIVGGRLVYGSLDQQRNSL